MNFNIWKLSVVAFLILTTWALESPVHGGSNERTTSSQGTPESKKATLAINIYAQELQDVEQRHAATIDKARTELVASLEAAKREVMLGGDLDEANAIQSVIKNPARGASLTMKSRAAALAYSKYTSTLLATNDRREEAACRAKSTLVSSLEEAKLAAMRDGNLDEANAIQAVINKNRPIFDYGDARRIVFICGANGSMTSRLKSAKIELTDAVSSLKPTQSFNILFYTDGGITLAYNKGNPVPATPENKRAANAYIASIAASGTTDPVPAIEYAFKQSPQLVYFLSNGEFVNLRTYDEVVATFKKSNVGSKAKVNTIQFQTNDTNAIETLKSIAAAAGGTVRPARE